MKNQADIVIVATGTSELAATVTAAEKGLSVIATKTGGDTRCLNSTTFSNL